MIRKLTKNAHAALTGLAVVFAAKPAVQAVTETTARMLLG